METIGTIMELIRSQKTIPIMEGASMLKSAVIRFRKGSSDLGILSKA